MLAPSIRSFLLGLYVVMGLGLGSCSDSKTADPSPASCYLLTITNSSDGSARETITHDAQHRPSRVTQADSGYYLYTYTGNRATAAHYSSQGNLDSANSIKIQIESGRIKQVVRTQRFRANDPNDPLLDHVYYVDSTDFTYGVGGLPAGAKTTYFMVGSSHPPSPIIQTLAFTQAGGVITRISFNPTFTAQSDTGYYVQDSYELLYDAASPQVRLTPFGGFEPAPGYYLSLGTRLPVSYEEVRVNKNGNRRISQTVFTSSVNAQGYPTAIRTVTPSSGRINSQLYSYDCN